MTNCVAAISAANTLARATRWIFCLAACAAGCLLFGGRAEGSLFAHWKLDETSGTTVFDSAGTNHGILGIGNEPTINQPGVFDQAYLFNSSENDRVALGPVVGNFSGFATGSITGWFNTSSTPRGALFSYREITTDDRLVLEVLDSGAVQFLIREAASNVLQLATTATYEDGQWHHLAVIQDGSFAQLYVDGTLVTSFGTNINSGAWFDDITIVSPPASPPNYGLSLGYENRAGAANVPFNGLLDDFAVFDHALTPAELNNVIALGAENFAVPEPSGLALFSLLGVLAAGYCVVRHRGRHG